MIDSHVHLNRSEFAGDTEDVLVRSRQAGVTGFLNVGYDLETSHQSIALAVAHPDILATVGIHPHDALLLADDQGKTTSAGEKALHSLEEMAAHPKVVAIGEIGLDFFRDLSPRPAQLTALTAQLVLADKVDLPVVFRAGCMGRDPGAHRPVRSASPRRGPALFQRGRLPALVAAAGADMILLETDAPWLPPVPHRGQRNESSFLVHTRDKVAEILKMDPAEVAQRTTSSFDMLLGGRSFR